MEPLKIKNRQVVFSRNLPLWYSFTNFQEIFFKRLKEDNCKFCILLFFKVVSF